MRKLLSAAVLTLLVGGSGVAGCGDAALRRSRHTPRPRCSTRNPPAMGEGIRATLCSEHKLSLVRPPTHVTATAPLCYDVSRWQGDIDLRGTGVRCLIVQANDGTSESNPFASEQVKAAEAVHARFGFYTFLDGRSGARQADVAARVARRYPRRSLGLWADAEQPSAYAETCAYVARARQIPHTASIVGVYSAPGIYAGGRCAGYLWPAEWGASSPYPFAGYPASAIRLWQYCGTCAIDRDMPRGGLLRPACRARCRRDRTLRADIAHRRRQERLARAHAREDLALERRWRRERPGCMSPHRTPRRCERKAALVRDIARRANDRTFLLALIRTDARLIARWKREL